jgi:hypothetical protein
MKLRTFILPGFLKRTPQDFLTKVNQEFVDQRVRPHIEIRLLKILNLVKTLKIR